MGSFSDLGPTSPLVAPPGWSCQITPEKQMLYTNQFTQERVGPSLVDGPRLLCHFLPWTLLTSPRVYREHPMPFNTKSGGAVAFSTILDSRLRALTILVSTVGKVGGPGGEAIFLQSRGLLGSVGTASGNQLGKGDSWG